MRGRGRLGAVAAALLALALIGSALAATSRNAAKPPIVIGWAFDGSGAMAPFDGPALAAAKLRVNQINAKGGVNGRELQIQTCDTQGNKADVARACALRLLGGKIVANETYQSLGGNNVQNAVSRLNDVKANVYVTSTAGAFGALSSFITGLRTLGNNTPVLNSWAGDGTYWLPASPKVTNYWFVTFASVFGDDPNPAVNKLAKEVKAATGGFITGPSAIDGVVTAIKRAHGSTKGSVLAGVMQKFKKVPTISGNISFSAKLHTVFGRRYRVIRIQDNVPKVVGTIVAKVVPKI